MRSVTSFGLIAALLSSLRTHNVLHNEPTFNMQQGGFGKCKHNTTANNKYFHSTAATLINISPDYHGYNDWQPTKFRQAVRENSIPKRRGYRKGVNTVPRAPVSSLHAISFGHKA